MKDIPPSHTKLILGFSRGSFEIDYSVHPVSKEIVFPYFLPHRCFIRRDEVVWVYTQGFDYEYDGGPDPRHTRRYSLTEIFVDYEKIQRWQQRVLGDKVP